MVNVDISELKTLYCPVHDAEYKWNGKFTEKKCNDKHCEYCITRPKEITDSYCHSCPRKEICISWGARKLKKEITPNS